MRAQCKGAASASPSHRMRQSNLQLVAALNQDQMVSELGLDGALDLTHGGTEDHLVKLGNHLTGAELAQGAATLSGGTGAVLAGQIAKLGASLDFGQELQGLGFVLNHPCTLR
eukprot:NODE_16994_length_383_cov_13.542308_g16678_i0.p1 GENE.NODE_16994_length_383_cov_13.542308_g16678_i0~~NODE_16994_length_383_cov_13.542308_g16678_i0.p1  ORF type:complete len:126 (-),score=25.46 NODE_16994_length_383_cov_13.542308_g16678_i0:4-342(-)